MPIVTCVSDLGNQTGVDTVRVGRNMTFGVNVTEF